MELRIQHKEVHIMMINCNSGAHVDTLEQKQLHTGLQSSNYNLQLINKTRNHISEMHFLTYINQIIS